MYNNILEMLEATNFLNVPPEEVMEERYVEIMRDEAIPERWKIDMKNFVLDKYPEIHDRYEGMVLTDDEEIAIDNLSEFIESFEEKEIEDRTNQEIVESQIQKHRQQKIDSEKEFHKKLEDEISERKDEIIDHIKKLRENVQKNADAEMQRLDEEIKRLENGDTMKAVDLAKGALAKKQKELESGK